MRQTEPVTAEIFLLALGSMFWPILLLVDVVAFRTSKPITILAWFLAGGLLTTVVIGSVLVLVLDDATDIARKHRAVDAWVLIAVGVLALLLGLALRRRWSQPVEHVEKGPSRVERYLSRGAPLAFAAGIVLNLVPGLLPVIAMKNIAELGYSRTDTVVVVLCFYVIMFTFVEAPLLAFLFAPEWTSRTVNAFNAWLSRNLRTFAWAALVVFGAAELVHGLVVGGRGGPPAPPTTAAREIER